MIHDSKSKLLLFREKQKCSNNNKIGMDFPQEKDLKTALRNLKIN